MTDKATPIIHLNELMYANEPTLTSSIPKIDYVTCFLIMLAVKKTSDSKINSKQNQIQKESGESQIGS